MNSATSSSKYKITLGTQARPAMKASLSERGSRFLALSSSMMPTAAVPAADTTAATRPSSKMPAMPKRVPKPKSRPLTSKVRNMSPIERHCVNPSVLRSN